MAGIDPDLKRQLMTTLQRCDVFASNDKLRAVFVDGRLSPWAYNIPEGESIAGRVQAIIAFLHDKANAQGQNALFLLLNVLREPYDRNDAYYSELSALIAKLSNAPSSCSPAISPTISDSYTPYETAMQTLLARLGQTHPRYNEALIYQQRLNENLQGTRLYGDTETRRAERAEILARLNALTRATLNTLFGELGSAPTTAVSPGGSPYGGEDVTTGGDFAGRDHITIIGSGNIIGTHNPVIVSSPPADRSPVTPTVLPDRMRLLALLTQYFNLDELNTLCFALGVNYDELGGSGLTGKARELIAYCERHACLPELIKAGKTLRPELDWS